MRWVGRLFDERDTLVRLVLLDLSGLGYLALRPSGAPQPTATQWALAVAAFASILVLYRRPLVALLVQVVLLGTASVLVEDQTINQVGASWALLELTMRAHRALTVWLSAALLVAVFMVADSGDWPGGLARSLFGAGTVVGLPVLLGLVVRSSRELARQAEDRAAGERRRRDYEARAARADERAAIARELHDVVAHHVASMVLRVGVARHVLPDVDPRVAAVFDDIHGTGTAALADLRRLVALLRAPGGVSAEAAITAIEPGALPAALRAAADSAARAGLTIDAMIAPETGTLDAVRGLAVLRLTQEALTNVAKHAGPTARARLAVTMTAGAVHLEVTDEGDPDTTTRPDRPAGGGHGLTGMRERVEVVGGHLHAGPSGSGWRVTAVLPAPADTP